MLRIDKVMLRMPPIRLLPAKRNLRLPTIELRPGKVKLRTLRNILKKGIWKRVIDAAPGGIRVANADEGAVTSVGILKKSKNHGNQKNYRSE